MPPPEPGHQEKVPKNPAKEKSATQLRDWEKITLFVFGSFFFSVLLIMSVFAKEPTHTQWYIDLCVLSMSAAGVAALLPGAINLKLHSAIRATGALSVFVFVFYFGRDEATVVQGIKSHVEFPGNSVDPHSADIYVWIDSKFVAKDTPSSPDAAFALEKDPSANVKIVRGGGGILIDYGAVPKGAAILVGAKDAAGKWWVSNDTIVPEGDLGMTPTDFEKIRNRIDRAR